MSNLSSLNQQYIDIAEINKKVNKSYNSSLVAVHEEEDEYTDRLSDPKKSKYK